MPLGTLVRKVPEHVRFLEEPSKSPDSTCCRGGVAISFVKAASLMDSIRKRADYIVGALARGLSTRSAKGAPLHCQQDRNMQSEKVSWNLRSTLQLTKHNSVQLNIDGRAKERVNIGKCGCAHPKL